MRSFLIFSSEIRAECYRNYTTKQPKEDLQEQLTQLVSNEMLYIVAMLPNPNTLSDMCLSIPVGTASVERSFLDMKLIKLD